MIRRSLVWGVLFLFVSLGGVADAGRTKLCHVSPGAQPQTIEVTQAADVHLHLAHGDVIGSCTDPAVCSAVCDDHNACTVNDGVQTKGGCTCRPQAVTCVQDANFCTAEIFNPATGTCDSVPTNEGVSGYDASSCTQHNGTCHAGTCSGGAGGVSNARSVSPARPVRSLDRRLHQHADAGRHDLPGRQSLHCKRRVHDGDVRSRVRVRLRRR